MTTNGTLVVMMAALAIGAAAWAVKSARAMSGLTRAHRTVAAETDALSIRLRELETERATAEKTRAELEAEIARRHAAPQPARSAPPVPSSRPAPPPVSAPASAPRSMAEQDDLMKDPALQLLRMSERRHEFVLTHGPFFHREKLTPVQIEQLLDALARHDAHEQDVAAIARAQRLRRSDPAVVALREQGDAELREAAVGILGPEGHARLQDYERAVPVREYVGKFAGAAALAGMPLTVDQAERLTQVIARSDARYANGGAADIDRVNWEQSDAGAQAVLTPEQHAFFTRVELAGARQSRWSRQWSKAMFEALRRFGEMQSGAGTNPGNRE